MFECHVCGCHSAKLEEVSEVFEIEGRRVLMERIPAQVCERCGEATFSLDTAERVRQTVQEDGHSGRTVPLEVFAFH